MSATAPHTDVEKSTIRKISWRFLPIIIGAYFIAYVDRVDIGMVKAEMAPDIGMSDVQFGLASGLIFIGLIFFEVPSNKLALKWTPRVWIPRIMVTWGIVVIATASITSTGQLNILRILLGLAEAGMAPAVFLYLSQWFPAKHRAKALAGFYLSLPLAMAVGSPLTGWLLEVSHNWFGLTGWRWVFLIQGVAAIAVAFPVFRLLGKTPSQAGFLSPAERDWLCDTMAAEEAAKAGIAPKTFWRSIIDKRVLVLGVVYLLLGYGVNALVYWLPSIIDDASPGLSSLQLGLLSAAPFVVAAIGIWVVGVIAHRTQARLWNILAPALIAIAGFGCAAAFMDTPAIAFAAIAISLAGALAVQPQFWTLPSAYLTGASAAGGVAIINAINNIGGFAGPYTFGLFSEVGGDSALLPFLAILVAEIGSVVLIVFAYRGLRRDERGRAGETAATIDASRATTTRTP